MIKLTLSAMTGVIEVYDDVRRIEQNNEVPGGTSDCVDALTACAQKHRARPRHHICRPRDYDLHIHQFRWRIDVANLSIAGDFRHHRADDFRLSDLVTDRLERIARNRRLEKDASHPLETLFEHGEQRVGPDFIK